MASGHGPGADRGLMGVRGKGVRGKRGFPPRTVLRTRSVPPEMSPKDTWTSEQLHASNQSTINSTLNITGNIIGSGTALTNLNYNAILNPPTLVSFNNPSTFISTLNISGNTTLNNATTCRSSLNVSGLTTLSGNLDCGGGIAINGSNAFYNDTSLDAVNKSNTYINFKMAGATNDWCYLRQIGQPENFKLAFDFLDDIDARFCIRSISPYSNPNDTVIECFTVDNGNVSCTGYLTCGNNVWNRSADGVYRTYYATNEISYYCCGGNSTIGHIFYNNSYSNVFQIKNNGDIQSTGKINLNGELVNGNWKMTNDSDYCRLYNNAGTSYFNFAAREVYAANNLTVLGTSTLYDNLTIGSYITLPKSTTSTGILNLALGGTSGAESLLMIIQI